MHSLQQCVCVYLRVLSRERVVGRREGCLYDGVDVMVKKKRRRWDGEKIFLMLWTEKQHDKALLPKTLYSSRHEEERTNQQNTRDRGERKKERDM